jgi:hypothetical protein
MMSKAKTNTVLRLPHYRAPSHQHTAWFDAVIWGGVTAAAAGAVACLPLAGWHPDHLWPAVQYEAGQAFYGWRHHVSMISWPLELSLPVAVAGSSAIGLGALGRWHGHKPGFVHRTGYQIVKPERVFRGRKNGVGVGPARLSRQDETNGILIVAGQGGGKTVVISRMIKQVWKRGERALILDGKPEFAGALPNLHGDGLGEQNKAGSKTWLLALSDTRAARWAVGEDVYDRVTAGRWASSLTAALDPQDGKFWTEGAKVFIEVSILMCIESFGQKWGLGDFYTTLLGLLAVKPAAMKKIVAGYLPIGSEVITEKAEQTLAGFTANVGAALKPIDTMVRYETLKSSKNTISIRRWLKTRDHLIIGSASSDMRASAAFANALIELAAEQILLRPDASPNDSEAATWLFLDEFGAAGRCDLLRKQMIKLRSKRARVVIGIQSLQQLAEEYGDKAAQIILGSMATLIIGRCLGGGNEGDGEWACAQLGKVGGDRWVQPTSQGQHGHYEHVERDLVPATEFSRLGPQDGIRLKQGELVPRGNVIGNRLIIRGGSRTTEVFLPVEDIEPLRDPIITTELAVSTPLNGRKATSLSVLEEKLAQQAEEETKAKRTAAKS